MLFFLRNAVLCYFILKRFTQIYSMQHFENMLCCGHLGKNIAPFDSFKRFGL